MLNIPKLSHLWAVFSTLKLLQNGSDDPLADWRFYAALPSHSFLTVCSLLTHQSFTKSLIDLLLFLFSERTKQVANFLLLSLMVGAIYLHWMVDDKLERSAPALVFFFMLTCRLVVEWQIQRQILAAAKQEANQETKSTNADTTATKATKSE